MINKNTNEKVVLKESNQNLKNKQARSLFYQEVKTLASISHPAIVKFVGWAVTPKNKGHIYLILAEKGSLAGIIKNSREGNPDPLWDDTHKFIISYGIAIAMRYLHKYKNTVHRDLKCENILLDANLYPYITNFGTSKETGDIQTSQTITQTTAQIMPPEFIDNWKKHNRKPYIDVYSYAMLFPGLTVLQITEKVTKGQRPEFPESNTPSESWRNLIDQCWHQDFRQRPTFEKICEILESPCFNAGEIDRGLFESYKQSISNCSSYEEVVSCIDQLRQEAEEGNPDSQLAFALRLYNGFEIEQNRDEAKRYFELSADKGNAESQLCLSLILAREGDVQRSVDYLQKSINSGCPEAYSNYAQQLIDCNKIDEALPYLQYAIQRGSISAMNAYGNICELNSQNGCPDIFYRMASSCCHCLDSVGLYFPIDYKVYKCDDCGIEVCEGCAKSCHKKHNLIEVGKKNAFVCDCGQNHFTDDKNKKHCSIEFVGEMKCDEKPVLYQHLFRCLDCSNDKGMFICKSCAENCHVGHHVVDCGVRKGFCNCGLKKFNQKCKNSYFVDVSEGKCSCQSGNYPVLQRWFQCMTCGLYGSEQHGVCLSCAQKCHSGHVILDRGVKRNKCMCIDTNNCQLKK